MKKYLLFSMSKTSFWGVGFQQRHQKEEIKKGKKTEIKIPGGNIFDPC